MNPLKNQEEPWIVLIDGRAGAGKTTLAARYAVALGAVTLHMDDLYAGWGGLAAGSENLVAALKSGVYRRFDWEEKDYGTAQPLALQGSLVVEGVGAITGASLRAANRIARVHAIWLEAPTQLRRERALARDGDLFAREWSRWATQEEAHMARNLPLALAHELIFSELLAAN